MRIRRTIGLSFALLVVSAPAMAKETLSGHQDHPASVKPKAVGDETRAVKQPARRGHAGDRAALQTRSRHAGRTRHRTEALPPPDRLIGQYRAVGEAEVGKAAWYGGRHLGRRTASGERLDAIHPTAAHRSLPLHSLVRVTNLRNGRSVIATINDRGPVSRSLLIDLSPSCAEELDMMHSGIAKVTVEPVAPASDQTR